jgi:hypothetical protein
MRQFHARWWQPRHKICTVPIKANMEQMSLSGLETVPVNFEQEDLPPSIKEFMPAVYRDGDAYCCILGPDPLAGVFGCGDSLTEALKDWDHQLKERIKEHEDGDPVAEYIMDTMQAKNWVVW